jgi:hypothetical protein
MSKPPISISDLAAYASDPEGFVARRGRPANEAAAQYGREVHERFAREPTRGRRRALDAVILALILLLALAAWRALR